MIAQWPTRQQSVPTSDIQTCSCSRCSASPHMHPTLSSNTYIPLSVKQKSTSLTPTANITCSNNMSHPSQPPLVKMPWLCIPDSGFCRVTSCASDNMTPARPAAQIMDGPNNCLTGTVFKQRQLISQQNDAPIEAFSHGSSETLNGPSLEPSTEEFIEETNALHSIDSRSDHPSSYVSPVSEPRFGGYTPAEFDLDPNASLTPLFTSKPLKPAAHPMILMASPKVDHNLRKCATRNCNGLIVPSSTCLRCVECIKAEWTARKARGLSLPNRPRSGLVSILRNDCSEKSKQKSVTWADDQDNWISRIKRVRLKLPEPPPPRPIDEESSKLDLHILLESSQGTGTILPASNQKGSLLEVSSPWDSYLSELTEYSDDSDLETEGSEFYSSSSEETSDSEPESELPKLIIRIPARRPSTLHCIPTPVIPEDNRPLSIFTPYPEYRCQHELLADFHTKLSGFQDALTIHLLYMQPGNRNPKTVFGFDGQYSVVALDWNLFGRSDSIKSGILDLKEQLGTLGTMEFEEDTTTTITDNGIFMHFSCVHRFYNPLGPFYAEQEPRIMRGELEIAALPDNSHHILPGQRSVIRFRMVG